MGVPAHSMGAVGLISRQARHACRKARSRRPRCGVRLCVVFSSRRARALRASLGVPEIRPARAQDEEGAEATPSPAAPRAIPGFYWDSDAQAYFAKPKDGCVVSNVAAHSARASEAKERQERKVLHLRTAGRAGRPRLFS